MFFNQSGYSEVKKIILKITNNKKVSLNERVLLQKFVNKNPEILQQIKKAQYSRRLSNNKNGGLTNFMGELGLNGTFQNDHFNPKAERIEEWFSNAPSWLRRS